MSSRLKMTGEVVMQEGCNQGDQHVEPKHQHGPAGPTSLRRDGHERSIAMPGDQALRTRAPVLSRPPLSL